VTGADLPPSCREDRIVADWLTAVRAYRSGDSLTLADALVGPPMADEAVAYARLFALVAVASRACGHAQRASTPRTDPGKFYGTAVLGPDGKRADPNDSTEAANAVAAARLMTAAANGDEDMVFDLIAAHMPPDAAIERAGVLLDLITLYCAHTDRTARW